MGRDVVIILGAGAYRLLLGPFDFAPRVLSKINMGVQVSYLVLVLANALYAVMPPTLDVALAVLVALVAIASGAHYVLSWSQRAVIARGTTEDA